MNYVLAVIDLEKYLYFGVYLWFEMDHLNIILVKRYSAVASVNLLRET